MRPAAPLLGAAVVVGASRSSARHAYAEAEQRNAQAQHNASQAAAQKAQVEAAQNERTQAAVRAALEEERAKDAVLTSTSQSRALQYENGHAVEAVTGYCSGCGNIRRGQDKFCGCCGRMHPVSNDAIRSPPEYSSIGQQIVDGSLPQVGDEKLLV